MKRRLLTFLSVLFALALSLTCFIACDEATGGEERGEYYCDLDGTEQTLLIDDGFKAVLKIGGGEESGKYTLEGETMTFTFSEAGKIDATYRDDVIAFSYKGTDYRFLRKTMYTVTFDTDGGSSVTAQQVVNGRTATEPQAPTKAGFVFVGWYEDAAFQTRYIFSRPVTGDMKLYARFAETVEGQSEFTVTFDLGYAGEAPEARQTTGGKIFDLPEVQRDGYTFVGWWVSHYQNREKLTYQYKEQTLAEDTTLFAVWGSDAPAVSAEETGISWTASGVNNSYTVRIVGPETNVTNSQSTTTYAFDFTKQPAGEYEISVTLKGLTTTVYYRNKALARVSSFKVESGDVLVWNPVEGADEYSVTISCGNPEHDHTEPISVGNKTSYNFSACDMKAGGILFTVTASGTDRLPSVSDTFCFERSLEAVSGLTVDSAADEARWNAVDHATAYKVSVLQGGSEVYSGTVTEPRFSLKEFAAGSYTVKVTPTARGYNAPAAVTADYSKTRIATPANLRVNGSTVEWDDVSGASGYELKVGEKVYPLNGTSFTFTDDDFIDGLSVYEISVRARSSSGNDSLFSDVLSVRYGAMGEKLDYRAGTVYWDPVFGVTKFAVRLNDADEAIVDGNSYHVTFKQKGDNVITVCSISEDGTRSDWVSLTVTVYAITFDPQEGRAVDTRYWANGDEIELPVSERNGYQFGGWYTAPGGAHGDGVKYDESFFTENSDLTLFAGWVSNTYTVELDAGEYAQSGVPASAKVSYREHYQLPVPQSKDITKAFYGWFTERNGNGIRYTDYEGNGINVWGNQGGLKLYAAWADIFTFKLLADGRNYSVSKGAGIDYVKEVLIPQSYMNGMVTTVDDFSGCKILEAIYIPDTVQVIELASSGAAFSSCPNLREVNIIPVKGNHDKIFESDQGVLLRNNRNTGYKELFYYPKAKTGSYTIPDGVQVIPAKVFYQSKLTNVTIPGSVILVEAQAFYDSDSLTRVDFAEAEESEAQPQLTIATRAFGSCGALSYVELPSHLTEFASDVFSSCTNLTDIVVRGGNENAAYTDRDGILCRKVDGGLEAVFCPKGKSGTLEIDPQIVEIGDSAFSSCTKIQKVIFHENVRTIGKDAFKSCTSITEIEFEGDASSNVDLTIKASAFYGCTALSSLTLPENLVGLGQYAFGGIEILTTVTVNSGAPHRNGTPRELAFEINAFADNDSLKKTYLATLYLGPQVPVIDDIGAVFGKKLTEVFVADNPNYKEEGGVLYDAEQTSILYYPEAKTGAYVMPDTILKIGANVFNGRTGLTSVTISANIEQIGLNAFYGCTNLKEVIFKELESETSAIASEAPLTLDEGAFRSCSNLTSITLPDRVTSIGERAFGSCAMLKEFTIPKNVTFIGDSAFSSCSRLKTIRIPAGVLALGDGSGKEMSVFNSCTSLETIEVDPENNYYTEKDGILYGKTYDPTTETYLLTDLIFCPIKKAGVVTVPSSVRVIWTSAFRDNEGITEIKFEKDTVDEVTDPETGEKVPGSLEICAYAFLKCAKLTEVILPHGTNKFDTYSFEDCYALEHVFIPNTVTVLANGMFWECFSLYNVEFEDGEIPLEVGTDSSSSLGVFYDCIALKEIRLPERTVSIGKSAFKGCVSLHTVYLPASLQTISESAFQDTTSLETVEIASGSQLQSIGMNAFRGSALTSFDLPEGLKTIGSYAFAAAKIKYLHAPRSLESIDGGAYQYSEITEIIFPDNSELTTLGNSPFLACDKLVKVDFGENSKLQKIDRQNFKFCTSLVSIEFPASLQSIGQNQFEGCYSLKEVTFEEGSQLNKMYDRVFYQTGLEHFEFPESSSEITLGKYLFEGCMLLEQVHLSTSIKKIDDVFIKCPSLKLITVAPGNENFSEKDGVLYNADGTAVRFMYADSPTGTLIIDENINTIGSSAYQAQMNITNVYIPANVQEIGNYAFQNCINLEKVVFAEDSLLRTIGTNAFENCSSLESIEGLPSSLSSIGNYAFARTGFKELTVPSATTYGTYVYAHCKSLTSVKLPEDANVTKLGNNMFVNCSALTDITVPANITALPNYAFQGCVALEHFEIPNTVTSLGSYLFDGCTSLSSVTFGSAMSIKALGNYMFRGCTSLHEVDLPKTLNFLGQHTFENSGLRRIDLSEFKDLAVIGSSATGTSGSYLFDGCSELESVILPDTVTKISGYTFRNCEKLTHFEYDPSKITLIGTYCFYNSGITSITVPALVDTKNSGAYMFANCAHLQTVKFTSGITHLMNNMFENCTALEEVTIPASLTTIQKYVFDGCTSLHTVNFEENVNFKSLGESMFANCTALKTIKLPTTLNCLGIHTFENSGLTSIDLSELSELKYLGYSATTCTESSNSYVFQGCEDLETVNLPANVTRIGGYAFNGCLKLKEIDLTYIDFLSRYALTGCGIEEVYIPQTLTTIGYCAFSSCPYLRSIEVADGNGAYDSEDGVLYTSDHTIWCYPAGKEIPNGKLVLEEGVSIGYGAFIGCENVKDVSFPESLTTIDSYAFYQSGLERITIPATVEAVCDYAFSESTLKEITFEGPISFIKSVASNGTITYYDYQFAGCSDLTSVTFKEGNSVIPRGMFLNCTSLTSFDLTGVEYIGISAFDGSGLESVVVPETVTSIGNSAFANSKLKSVTYNAVNAPLITEDATGAVTNVATGIFKYCTDLAEVTLSDELPMIATDMFLGCVSLTTLKLPEGTIRIGNSAFSGSGITSMVIPETVRVTQNITQVSNHLGTAVFQDCTALEYVKLPSTVYYIGSNFFSGCSNLHTVEMPSVSEFGNNCFAGCVKLELVVKKQVSKVGAGAFSGFTAEQTIYFEGSAHDVYSAWGVPTGTTLAWWDGCEANLVFDYTASKD